MSGRPVGRPPSQATLQKRAYGGPITPSNAGRTGSGATASPVYGRTYGASPVAATAPPHYPGGAPMHATPASATPVAAYGTAPAAAAPASAGVPLTPAYRPRTTKRPRVERRIPTDLEQQFPQSKLYTSAVQLEKKLDAALLRRRLEREDALRRPAKTKRTLRVFISNLAANQPHFDRSDADGDGYGQDRVYPQQPSWTLRIEGRLLEHNASRRAGTAPKFSSFLNSLMVEFEHDPELHPELGLVEWKATTNGPELDGFEIKRAGDEPVNSRVILQLKWSPPRFKLSRALAEVLGIHTETQAAVLMALYKYIKLNKLQSSEDRNLIVLNEPLKQIFRTETLSFALLPQAIMTQLEPAEPIVLPYRINLDKEYSVGEVAYDIELDVDDTFNTSLRAEGMSESHLRDLEELDGRIADSLATIHLARRKRDFLAAFAANPVYFVNAWLDAQARDLKVILGENAIGADEQRRTALFQQPWVAEAVVHYLGDRTAERADALIRHAMQGNRGPA